ncbi:hypothetical protein NIES4103_01370 [Nostoc sp. NIES-4103]|nr:hypothetical protein NIES4103_01370 [Nostoc sp. NIES-4103]
MNCLYKQSYQFVVESIEPEFQQHSKLYLLVGEISHKANGKHMAKFLLNLSILYQAGKRL